MPTVKDASSETKENMSIYVEDLIQAAYNRQVVGAVANIGSGE